MAITKSIHLALAIHHHQPVGISPSVLEEVFKSAYEPFLKVLVKHPKIKISMHYSGSLLQWLVEKHPEYAHKLRDLSNKGQIELLTGGFYEPILIAIPDRDKIGQIGKLTKYIEEKFAFTPKGLWLTERVWASHLPRSLVEAGVEYTLLDEHHFKTAGIRKSEDMLGYYATEELGNTIAVFPIHDILRQAIPGKPVGEAIEAVKHFANEPGNRLVCFAGRAGTFVEPQWFEKFFEKLVNTPGIKITSFPEYRKKFPPLGRIYIPPASYPEMVKWAGGMWRNFMIKYPEANDLHKKQLYVSHKVEKVKELEIKTRAQEDLWRGQANDAYWHGDSGGLTAPHLRSSAYQHLIKSEYLVDMYLRRGGPWLDVEAADYDKDLMDEILINSDKLNLYLRPSRGGQLFELDYKPKAANLQGLMSLQYPRYSFIDHFLNSKTTLADFAKTKYQEEGDFMKSGYSFDLERSHDQIAVKLTRDGHVAVKNEPQPVRVEKRVIVPRGEPHFTVELHLTNGTAHSLPLWYACELSVNFLSQADAPAGVLKPVDNLILKDTIRKIEITMTFSKTTEVWAVPIEADKMYQGTALVPHWQVTLGPKGTWKSIITFHLKEL